MVGFRAAKGSPIPVDDPKSRREYFRVETMLPFAYCSIVETQMPEPSRVKLNLSLGGVGFVVNRPLKLDDMLLIAITLPSPPVLHVVARVIRTEPVAGDASTQLVGARFTTLKLRDEARLHNYIVAVEREGIGRPDEA